MPPDYTEERLEPMEDAGCTTFLPLDAPPPKKKSTPPKMPTIHVRNVLTFFKILVTFLHFLLFFQHFSK